MSRIFAAATLFIGLALGLSAISIAARADANSVGPYKDKCTSISDKKGDSLSATCKDFFGNPVNDVWKATKVTNCLNKSLPGGAKGAVWNVDGRFRCVLSSAKSPNGHDDTVDIISKSETGDSSATTIDWRIDHPNVSQATTHYPHITFNQGDRIEVHAGGSSAPTVAWPDSDGSNTSILPSILSKKAIRTSILSREILSYLLTCTTRSTLAVYISGVKRVMW